MQHVTPTDGLQAPILCSPMKIALRWLNEYLEPGDVSAADAERALTFAGFPLESITELPALGNAPNALLDVEVTSNRGDVLSHIGVARELAAATGRALKLPAPNRTFHWFNEPDAPVSAAGSSQDVGAVLSVDNRVPEACPLFTARVIRGVKVGPSPKWLVAALESVGLRSINNVVDLTNFVAFEYGQPTHVFDLSTIATDATGKARLIIRTAVKGEKMVMLDDKTIELKGDEIVVADETGGGRAVSLAGVMGGLHTGVTERTVDVLVEAATWAPVEIRRAARRFGIRTDASYRFERTVDGRTIEPAAKRLATLITKLAGGRLLPGVIHAGTGAENQPPLAVKLRPARCRSMIGLELKTADVQRMLESHEISARPELSGASGGEPVLACTIPVHRPDLTREIDLIEEIARSVGLDKLPVHELVPTRIAPPQVSERAVDALAGVLTGLGFYETITFTFVGTKPAKAFVPKELQMLQVCDDRRKADPVLRPSAVISMLACRCANQDRGVSPDGSAGGVGSGSSGFRLYEISSVFAEAPAPAGSPKGTRGKEVEAINLALLADCCFPAGAKLIEQKQHAVRMVRGTIESVAKALGGESVRVEIIPTDKPPVSAYDPAACAEVKINGQRVGVMGVIAPAVQAEHGLGMPVVCAEINLGSLVALYPPKATVQALPAFPSIERDLSLIVAETVSWTTIDELVRSLSVPKLESWAFVTTYRGAQAGAGKKSVTFRMRFRDEQRTLTHDEVSPQVETIVAAAKGKLQADVRTA